ncbi:MAG: AP-2 family transcription factor, partial [Crocinitomicaceae bacterium]|nr:AP-2 family transcription factor [Crocinitomicaceae bacterium]
CVSKMYQYKKEEGYIYKKVKKQKVMKKLVMVFALGAMLGSCGGGAASIDVDSLDSPCACAEATVTAMEEAIEMGKDFKEIDDPSDEVRKEFQEDFKPIQAKMDEIKKKCKGDLNPDKADKDCEAVEKAKDLMKEFRSIR